MKDGDVLLLCTDGLTNFVESDEMCDLTKDDMFYEFAERLVDRANQKRRRRQCHCRSRYLLKGVIIFGKLLR